MNDRLELPEHYRKQVEEILRDRVPHAEVWAYGSRVDGTSYEASDLDLVVRAPGLKPISAMGMEALREAFRESNIPIIVEARDWARLPTSFHREIERNYVRLND